jgi:hypothetical protein
MRTHEPAVSSVRLRMSKAGLRIGIASFSSLPSKDFTRCRDDPCGADERFDLLPDGSDQRGNLSVPGMKSTSIVLSANVMFSTWQSSRPGLSGLSPARAPGLFGGIGARQRAPRQACWSQQRRMPPCRCRQPAVEDRRCSGASTKMMGVQCPLAKLLGGGACQRGPACRSRNTPRIARFLTGLTISVGVYSSTNIHIRINDDEANSPVQPFGVGCARAFV